MNRSKNIALAFTLIILLGFCLPWIKIKAPPAVVSGEDRVIQGQRLKNIARISGMDIPLLANGTERSYVINVIRRFDPDIKDPAQKSFLIWIVPALAVVMFICKIFWGNYKLTNLILGITGLLAFLYGLHEITTVNLDKLIVRAEIGFGLLMVLSAYLGFGLLSLFSFFKATAKDRQ
jgi:hypothetical protein